MTELIRNKIRNVRFHKILTGNIWKEAATLKQIIKLTAKYNTIGTMLVERKERRD